MKSRRPIVLALALALFGWLAVPSGAVSADGLEPGQLCAQKQVFSGDQTATEDPGPTGDLHGDPENWLGGQNLKPTPPVLDVDSAQAQSSSLLIAWWSDFTELLTRWMR